MATLGVIIELDDFALSLTREGLTDLAWHNLAHAMGQAFEQATRMQTITVTLAEMDPLDVTIGAYDEIVKVERA